MNCTLFCRKPFYMLRFVAFRLPSQVNCVDATKKSNIVRLLLTINQRKRKQGKINACLLISSMQDGVKGNSQLGLARFCLGCIIENYNIGFFKKNIYQCIILQGQQGKQGIDGLSGAKGDQVLKQYLLGFFTRTLINNQTTSPSFLIVLV